MLSSWMQWLCHGCADLEKLMKPLIEQKKRGYCFSVKQQSEWDDFSCQLAAITSGLFSHKKKFTIFIRNRVHLQKCRVQGLITHFVLCLCVTFPTPFAEYKRVEVARQNEMNDWIKFSRTQMSLAQRIDESQKSRMRTYYCKQKWSVIRLRKCPYPGERLNDSAFEDVHLHVPDDSVFRQKSS
jgi:hypothetical protein